MEQPPISRKVLQVGDLYSTFQIDRLVKNVSVKMLELYETAWKVSVRDASGNEWVPEHHR